eukprot:gnl/TRDRNA2_/TRDRNA2_140505_c1_seq3.p1 gnl/TRDRNA2_/TRDRNA2_140505_c1~~gnl/TRDRNA2_/TRDRNA2_140505_c1_seq3.p1  ORF type:complete len:103 (-),score=17.52 gnl/TRDRNA2_/TRDRNA2_140505_c1_seq3:16-324(-)
MQLEMADRQDASSQPAATASQNFLRRHSGAFGDMVTKPRVFLLMVTTNSMVNFDTGGTASVLSKLDWGCPTLHGEPNKNYDAQFPCLNEFEKGILGTARSMY